MDKLLNLVKQKFQIISIFFVIFIENINFKGKVSNCINFLCYIYLKKCYTLYFRQIELCVYVLSKYRSICKKTKLSYTFVLFCTDF